MSDTTASTPTLYEILLIMPPDILDFDAAIENLKEILTSHGASIVNEDNAGLRDLAYTIRKHKKGYYLILNLNFNDPAKISELENALNIEQSLLRYMILKMPNTYQAKTLAEYDSELEQEMKKKSAKKEEKSNRGSRPRVERPKVKKEESKKEEPKANKVEAKSPKEEKKEEKEVAEKEKTVKETKEVEDKVEEKEAEKAPSKETKKAEKLTDKQSEEKLKELDDKLKSIIDDPDISL